MSQLDTAELREMRDRHKSVMVRQVGYGRLRSPCCVTCDCGWPCDTARLLALLDELEAGPSEEELEAALRALDPQIVSDWLNGTPDFQRSERRLAEALHAAIKRSKT
jgi:hypothetical protein